MSRGLSARRLSWSSPYCLRAADPVLHHDVRLQRHLLDERLALGVAMSMVTERLLRLQAVK